MDTATNYPLLVFALIFVTQWLSAMAGWLLLKKRQVQIVEIREDFDRIVSAALTLLCLLIGFSFSMALTRYDQRKNYEEDEANAIGTEYLRCDLLPPATAESERALLRDYLDLRIRFYQAQDKQELQEIDLGEAQIQAKLWTPLTALTAEQKTPIMALAVAGMNDVLNSQGYTQAAYRNRIPPAAWGLVAAIAIGCNFLIGYQTRGVDTGYKLLPLLPFIIAIAFMLIADVDAPRHGIIKVRPKNLSSLADSLRPH